MLGILMLPLAFLLGQNLAQTALLIAVCFLVLIVELLNSAIEAVVDRVGHEHHELAGRAKDMGSAAVSAEPPPGVGHLGSDRCPQPDGLNRSCKTRPFYLLADSDVADRFTPLPAIRIFPIFRV